MCIVQKRDSGRLFAMKYVSRGVLDGRGALGGVIKEVELLASLEHPFLVNLWFSFQGNFVPSMCRDSLKRHHVFSVLLSIIISVNQSIVSKEHATGIRIRLDTLLVANP